MKWMGLFFGLLLATGARAQFTAETMLQPYALTNAAGEVLTCRLRAEMFPEKGKKYPLIVFLHGSGECGTDNYKQIKVGMPAMVRSLLKTQKMVMILAPQCQNGNWWVRRLARGPEYATPAEPMPSMSVVFELIRHLIDERQADPDRIYVTGLSLGGFGTWDAIQREPGMFAAAIPVCGGGDIRRVRELRKMPIWIFHGSADKNVSVDCSRRMAKALKDAKSKKFQYTEYEGADHFIWDRVYGNEEVIEWLLKQKRDDRPWWKFW